MNIRGSASNGGHRTPFLRIELTQTQVVMLKALADGLSMKDIASEHGISIHTVHTHLRRAYRMLEARGSNNAVAIAIRTGLIE